jgi:response regulator RpfG family c-di-GMP phosphodiesterase
LILAGESLSEMTGSDLLNEAQHLHPHAKRALLVEWGALGDRRTGKAIFDSIAHGRIDHYLLKPSAPPDELFHNTISGLLLEWAEARRGKGLPLHHPGRGRKLVRTRVRVEKGLESLRLSARFLARGLEPRPGSGQISRRERQASADGAAR